MALLLVSPETRAGSFFCDFDSIELVNARLYGQATLAMNEGVDNRGALKLAARQRHQLGTFIIDPLDGNLPISGFEATFKAFMGGGDGACGFAFCLARDLPNIAFGEDGAGSGLIVTFDTFRDHVDGDTVPGVRVWLNRKIIARQSFARLRQQRFVDVSISLVAGSVLQVNYGGVELFTNLVVRAPSLGGRFSLSARTGDSTDNHLVDDLRIETQVVPKFVESFLPTGDNAAPDAEIKMVLRDFARDLDPKSIQVAFDGSLVVPTTTFSPSGGLIQFQPPDLLVPGSSHRVELFYADMQKPPKTNWFSYRFAVNGNIILSK